ncbi:MAG: hypothetical protein ACYC9D_10610 [Candidatus Dormibacteria bacterium]
MATSGIVVLAWLIGRPVTTAVFLKQGELGGRDPADQDHLSMW